MTGPYILRANVTSHTASVRPVPPGWERLGGRGLIARILNDEVPAQCHPLGPGNRLLFVPGLLAGRHLTSCDRLSIGCKSPLTGGVKESNAGGTTAVKLARLGIKALIVEGQPREGWHLLHVSRDGGRFEAADDLAGLGAKETAARLRARFGPGVGVALIGPGGEMRLCAAGIQNLDKDGVPSRIAGRGGTGAVMAAKRLKAIVVDDAGGEPPPAADPKGFTVAVRRLTQSVLAQPLTRTYAEYGTAAMVATANAFGALPTRNYAAGQFEGADRIAGEALRDLIEERGGEGSPTHACMPGCVVRCSNAYPDAGGNVLVSALEYETIALLGSNLGIADLDIIATLNREINDLGLDTIEIGSALGVAAEAGLMRFGDGQRALALVGEIRQGTPLGRVLGSGAATAGRVFGVTRVPVVKGQAMAAYDPRAIKGTGVTYATSPQGADHTAGLTIRAQVDHLNPAGQAAVSAAAQVNMAGYDTLGACIFTGAGFAACPGIVGELLDALYGWDLGPDALQELGREAIMLERRFNRAAGFSAAQDRLPDWMSVEPVPPHGAVFDVPAADLDATLAFD